MAEPFVRSGTRLRVIQEQSPGVIGANRPRSDWHELDFSNFPDLGGTISRLEDSRVTSDNQRKDTALSRQEISFAYNTPYTLSTWLVFREAFMYSEPARSDLCDLQPSGASTSGGNSLTGFTAFTASQVGTNRLPANSLVSTEGFENEANNKVFALRNAVSAGNTDLAVTETVVNETGAAFARAHFTGLRKLAAVTASWTYDANTEEATLTWANHGLAAVGLQEGQEVYIGSPNDDDTDIQHAMQRASGGTANDMHGSATVKSISAGAVVFEDPDFLLRRNSASINTDLDIMFSEVQKVGIRGQTNFRSPSFTFEIEFAPDDPSGRKGLMYFRNVKINTFNIAVNSAEEITMSLTFLPRGFVSNVQLADRLSPASFVGDDFTFPLYDRQTGASLDVINFHITGLDTDEEVFPDDISMSVNTNTTGKQSVGKLFDNISAPGRWDFDYETTVNLENLEIFNTAIKSKNVRFRCPFFTADGATIFKTRSSKVSVGPPTLPEGEGGTATVAVTGQSNQESGTSLIVSTIRDNLPIQSTGEL